MTPTARDVAGQRDGWTDADDDCAAGRKVPELLAEQIEAADILLLNKIDLAGPKQVVVAEALARSINNKAILEKVEFGKVLSPKQIIRDDKAGRGDAVVEANDETDNCTEPSCTSHDHSHSHSHESHASDASSEVCKDSACAVPECSEHGDASSATTDDCSDPDCTDDSHDHSHSHSLSKTHTENLGIVNFVYRADRPFETRNLMSLLNTWPVPIKEDLEGLEHFEPASAKDDSEPAGRESPFFGVLRSKGFCWLAPTTWKAEGGDQWRHDTAMYWSHAGKHFGVTTAGKWWATLAPSKMKDYFKNDPKEYERIRNEDFVSEKWGDRRQEIVFIGANIDEEKITKALDNCLLGDKGMERYTEQLFRFY
jgi:G3E family GTPase